MQRGYPGRFCLYLVLLVNIGCTCNQSKTYRPPQMESLAITGWQRKHNS